jgi:hypothetical protein
MFSRRTEFLICTAPLGRCGQPIGRSANGAAVLIHGKLRACARHASRHRMTPSIVASWRPDWNGSRRGTNWTRRPAGNSSTRCSSCVTSRTRSRPRGNVCPRGRHGGVRSVGAGHGHRRGVCRASQASSCASLSKISISPVRPATTAAYAMPLRSIAARGGMTTPIGPRERPPPTTSM